VFRNASDKIVTNTFIVLRVMVKLLMMFDGRLFSVREPVIVYGKRDGGIIADITSVRTREISRESFHSSFTPFRTKVFMRVFALHKLKTRIKQGFFHTFFIFEVNEKFL